MLEVTMMGGFVNTEIEEAEDEKRQESVSKPGHGLTTSQSGFIYYGPMYRPQSTELRLHVWALSCM